MKTTVDIPDELFRRMKTTAAMRGQTMKDFLIELLQRNVAASKVHSRKRRRKLPVIHLAPGQTLDLSNFNFDDLLP